MTFDLSVQEARLWLPSGAVDTSRVDAALGEAVGQWSAKWFAGSAWRPLGPLRERATSAAVRSWSSLPDGLALGQSVDADLILAGAMLGVTIDDGGLLPADRQLIEALARACVEDLQKRLAQSFRLPDDGCWRDGLEPIADAEALACAIGAVPDRPALELRVARDLLVAHSKASVRSLPPAIDLRPLAEGLVRQRVEMSALIGHCHLNLAELETLAEGDVIVLDRALALPLDLAIDGRPTARRCTVEQSGDGLALELLEPVFG